MFHSFKKSGRSATLTMSTKGGQATKVKLEVELDDATPPSSSPSSTSTSTAPSLPGCQATGDRHRPHGSARRRAKANARAAQHRIFQALPFPEGFSDAQSLPGPPPSRRPLQHHPSPTVEGRRKILTVKKPAGCQPTFATLNLDGAYLLQHLLQHLLHYLTLLLLHLHHHLHYTSQGNHLFVKLGTTTATASTAEDAPCSVWIITAATVKKRVLFTVMFATARRN